MPKHETAGVTIQSNDQGLLSKLRSHLPTLPAIPTLSMPALSKMTLPELPAINSLPGFLPAYVAKKLGITNNNVCLSTLAEYHATVVKYANLAFRSANTFLGAKGNNLLIGDFAAKVHSCSAQKADKALTEALTQFMTAQAAGLAVLKAKEAEIQANPLESSEESDDSSELHSQSDAGAELDPVCDVGSEVSIDSDEESSDESSEIDLEEQKTDCAAIIQAIAGLSRLYHLSKQFDQLSATYHRDPGKNRAALDDVYHQSRDIAREVDLCLSSVNANYNYNDLPDLDQIVANLPDTLDALLKNAPKGYAPSVKEKVTLAPRR